tara:strand:- start:141 stop:587 length:447 start_codon:yes stop_codon:yes gene_type:complete
MDKIIIFFSIFILFSNNAYSKTEYYLTLRNEKVNLRQGPSLDHPVKLVYKKKFLPVLVIDSSYNFRKIIDHQNNSGWIHISQLSKKKAALNDKKNSVIFKKPSKYSKPLALVEKGRLFLVKKCKSAWCKIKTENYTGWIMKKNLKGRL